MSISQLKFELILKDYSEKLWLFCPSVEAKDKSGVVQFHNDTVHSSFVLAL